MDKKNLLTRGVSGIIYMGLIVGSIFWGIIPFSCLAAVFGALAVTEFSRLCGDRESNPNFLPPLILDIAGVVALSFSWLVFPVFIWLCIFICRLILELYLKNKKPLTCMAYSLMTQLYIGLPLACMTFIARYWGLHLVLAIFLMIWINDTGAFITGCSFGRNRLFERISPKKSWEGFFGGLAFNLLAGWLFAIGGKHFWETYWNVPTWLLFGATVTVFSTWGDLIESMIKRSLQVKDSGNLIPGHGGILDRIDSLLLVMPAALLFLLLYLSMFSINYLL